MALEGGDEERLRSVRWRRGGGKEQTSVCVTAVSRSQEYTYKLWDLDLDTQAVSGLRPSPSRHFLSRFRVRSLQDPFLRLDFLHERFRRLRFCTKLVFRRKQLGREFDFEWWNGPFRGNVGSAECSGQR